jgi:hypothetical protein
MCRSWFDRHATHAAHHERRIGRLSMAWQIAEVRMMGMMKLPRLVEWRRQPDCGGGARKIKPRNMAERPKFA